MSEKPILFNTEMVRAILERRKTQTRRIVNNIPLCAPYAEEDEGELFVEDGEGEWYRAERFSPFQPGDLLYVREAWAEWPKTRNIIYRADDKNLPGIKWRPSIHMPKVAARIWLKVTGIECKRLNDMTEEDAIAEGFQDNPVGTASPLERFAALWDKTIKRADQDLYGWYANPWIWVIGFELIECDQHKIYRGN